MRTDRCARYVLATMLAVHAIAGVVVAVVSTRPTADLDRNHEIKTDFDRYYEIGTSPGRPYVDYQVEHPIATLLVFKALAQIPGGRISFGLAVVGLAALADAAVIAALVWGWGVPAAAAFAVMVLPIIDLVFDRIDLWSTAAATVAVAAWRRDRGAIAGAALAIGGAFKLWPLVLAPLLVVRRPASKMRPAGQAWSLTPLTSFIVTGSILGALALRLAGSDSVFQVLTFRGARGWQIESTVGSLVHLVSSSTLRAENGSWRIGVTSAPVTIAMFLAAAPICLWSSWRGAQRDRVGTGWLGAVASLLSLSALLSAQFVVWLAPAAAIAWTNGDRRSAATAALAIVLTAAFWVAYTAVVDGATVALLVVVLRNTALALLAGGALARLAKPPTGVAGPPDAI